jgi:hypothetical protein
MSSFARVSGMAKNRLITFPRADSIERTDEIGGFLSLPCNFGKPVLYEWDRYPGRIQEARQGTEVQLAISSPPRPDNAEAPPETRRLPEARRLAPPLQQRSRQDRDWSEIHLAASPKCFHLRSKKKRCGDDSDRLSAGRPFDLEEHRCEVSIQWQFIFRVFSLDRADAAIDYSLLYLHAEPFKIYFLPSHSKQLTGAKSRALVDRVIT